MDTQDAVRFGESVGVRVFETSAKENVNVEEVTSTCQLCPAAVFMFEHSHWKNLQVCKEAALQLLKVHCAVLLSSDVHGLHPHGAPGQEAEPEPSGEGTRAGEGHGQHERPEGQRPQEEREEMLLRRRRTGKLCLRRRRGHERRRLVFTKLYEATGCYGNGG